MGIVKFFFTTTFLLTLYKVKDVFVFAVPFEMPVESHLRRMERFDIESDHLFLCLKLWKSSMYGCSSGVVTWMNYCVRTFSFKTSRTSVATNCDSLSFRMVNPAKRHTKIVDYSIMRSSIQILNFSMHVRALRCYTSMTVSHKVFRLILGICMLLTSIQICLSYRLFSSL